MGITHLLHDMSRLTGPNANYFPTIVPSLALSESQHLTILGQLLWQPRNPKDILFAQLTLPIILLCHRKPSAVKMPQTTNCVNGAEDAILGTKGPGQRRIIQGDFTPRRRVGPGRRGAYLDTLYTAWYTEVPWPGNQDALDTSRPQLTGGLRFCCRR